VPAQLANIAVAAKAETDPETRIGIGIETDDVVHAAETVHEGREDQGLVPEIADVAEADPGAVDLVPTLAAGDPGTVDQDLVLEADQKEAVTPNVLAVAPMTVAENENLMDQTVTNERRLGTQTKWLNLKSNEKDPL